MGLAVECYKYTWNLNLLITVNEAVQTMKAMELIKERPTWSYIYAFHIVALMAISEVVEAFRILAFVPNESWMFYAVAIAAITYVPYFHVMHVLRPYGKKIYRRLQQKHNKNM